ncbi:MAG: type II toxin-antitoxin system RelE/ParE family toxin [Candidatus Aenigmarchaeota archaeon]|nr:type II toxin-antitoxin system RelE/ParE family toxin [Candidatus Aenigmarchaeota archaeon]
MAFKIVWPESAIKQLQKLERPIANRVFAKVDELKENPHRFLTKVVGSECFRLRIGDYRVLVDIDKSTITVLKIGHRKNIYN